jgi:subtilisin family serine protease
MAEPHAPQLKSFKISPPVRKEMDAQDPAHPAPIAVIISLRESKTEPERGLSGSKQHVRDFLQQRGYTAQESDFFVFARVLPADLDALSGEKDWVYQIWKDETCYAHLLASTDTVKASACWRTFDARGKGIVWAVLDTGVKADHPHFDNNVEPALSRNFSNSKTLDDCNGHGTHVAGIIAGCARPKADQQPYKASTLVEDDDDPELVTLHGCPSGMAPLTRIISVKVLDDDGTGSASAAIMGLEYLRKLNQNSRHIVVDGANMSLGYPFDPKWYGCGHSPLCEEVTRAVRSGLVVVISCGNSGYGVTKLDNGQEVPTWIDLSITDPANTEDAIAVGSVHKTAPHMYGVSYFSSKGPTGDGRTKPDLVAPGEKIISCSIHLDKGFEYEEKSGTSMAAPHVSGAAAAFLSAHPEFRGSPRQVKEILMKTATDLNRDRTFQGAGMIDTMRAISAV